MSVLNSRIRTLWGRLSTGWIVWLLIAASLAAGIGLRQPSPPDEPRFVLAARTMVETGQWLLPRRGIELYAEKPPVFMWLQAVAYHVVGNWDIAFLLPSLVGALLTLWLTYDIGRRLWNARVGRYAALALFATVQFGLMAKRGQIDMALVTMTTASLWGLLRHMLRGPDTRGLVIAGFFAGLGTVTKGVGFLPLLLLVPYAFAVYQRKDVVPLGGKQLLWLLGSFVAGVAVWLGPLGLALVGSDDMALQRYARELLFKQTTTRYISAWHHVQPAWYYLKVIATLWLPGCLLLPWLAVPWWKRLRRSNPRYLLLIGWALLVLLFFSASPGKREVYIFPILPALCLTAAPLLPAILRLRSSRILLGGYLYVIGTVALLLGGALFRNGPWVQTRLAGRDVDLASQHALAIWMLVLGIALVLIVIGWGRRHIGRAAVATSCTLWLVYGIGLMPALDPFASASRLMQHVRDVAGPNGQLGLVDWREQNYLQAGRSVTDFGFKAPINQQWELAWHWAAQAPTTRLLLVSQVAAEQCSGQTHPLWTGQANRTTWVLLDGTEVVRHCSNTMPGKPASVARSAQSEEDMP